MANDSVIDAVRDAKRWTADNLAGLEASLRHLEQQVATMRELVAKQRATLGDYNRWLDANGIEAIADVAE